MGKKLSNVILFMLFFIAIKPPDTQRNLLQFLTVQLSSKCNFSTPQVMAISIWFMFTNNELILCAQNTC